MTRTIKYLIFAILACYAQYALPSGPGPAGSQSVTISISLMILPDPAEQHAAAYDCARRGFGEHASARNWRCNRGDRTFRTVRNERNEDDITVVVSPI